jgi:hypothetical protein
MRFASYGWIITRDHLAEADNAQHRGAPASVPRVDRLGPSNLSPEIRQLLTCNDPTRINLALITKLEVWHWRCLDADGEIYYEGIYVGPGEGSMFGPLTDFAQPDAGATDIQYRRSPDDEWEAL